MKQFNFWQPTRLIYGSGLIDQAGKHIGKIGSKALVIGGQSSMRKYGFLSRLEQSFVSNNINFVSLEGVIPDPNSNYINGVVESYRDKNIDVIVGLGGGSSIDAAKAIATCLQEGNNVEEFLEGKTPGPNTLPIVAIPSTAGTSSELSKGAIITNSKIGLKQGVRGEAIFPRLALVDPTLTYSMPRKVTALTGFDVFCHAVETFISTKSNPITELFSIEAIRIVSTVLPELLKQLDRTDLRDKMVNASILMGYNLSNSSNCLPHRMQYPLGVLTGTSHQDGLASIYPAWVQQIYPKAKEEFNVIFNAMGIKGSSVIDCNHASSIIAEFIDSLSLSQTISDMGVERSQIDYLTKTVEGSLNVDPGYEDKRTVESIYLNSLKE